MDHLSPPPTYKRARELSITEENFRRGSTVQEIIEAIKKQEELELETQREMEFYEQRRRNAKHAEEEEENSATCSRCRAYDDQHGADSGGAEARPVVVMVVGGDDSVSSSCDDIYTIKEEEWGSQETRPSRGEQVPGQACRAKRLKSSSCSY